MNEQTDSERRYIPFIPDLTRELELDASGELYPLTQGVHDMIERYSLHEELGRGGMKRVVNADDEMTSRKIALALLHDPRDPKKVEAFIKEAKLTAGLQHPNIVPLHDVGFNPDGEPYFVMKQISGETLADMLRALRKGRRKVPFHTLIGIFEKVCDAVEYAHSRGIIHLDLKPENIHLGDYGEVLVCDWGLAKVVGDSETDEYVEYDSNIYNTATLHGEVRGTPGYMSPEQIDASYGMKSERTDIYALGAILYAILCYRAPVTGTAVAEIMSNTLQGEIKPPSLHNPSIPESLEAICIKALSLEQNQRYGSVSDLHQDINRWFAGFMTSAEQQSSIKQMVYLIKRHRQATAVSLLIAILTVLFVARIFAEKRDAEVQRQQAESALEQFKEEQARRAVVSRKASPRLVEVARLNIKQYAFKEALENICLAVDWMPYNQKARYYKGLILFYNQQFNAALKVINSSRYNEPPEREWVERLCEKYGKVKNDEALLSPQQIRTFITDARNVYAFLLGEHNDINISVLIANYACRQEYSLKDKLTFVELALRYSNMSLKELNFRPQIDGDHLKLSLARSPGLMRLEAISSLPVTHLNISFTWVKDITPILSLPLVECDFEGTRIIRSQDFQRIKTLKRVIYTHNLYPYFHIPGLETIKR